MFFSSWVVAIYFLLYTHEFCHDFRYICIHLGILGSQYKIWALEEESEHCRQKMGGRKKNHVLEPKMQASDQKKWAVELEKGFYRPFLN